MNFLPVGHTHEDIDALFGVFSKYLEQLDVYTVEGMQCYKSGIFVCDVCELNCQSKNYGTLRELPVLQNKHCQVFNPLSLKPRWKWNFSLLDHYLFEHSSDKNKGRDHWG